MKQSTLFNKLVIFLLFAAVASYLALSAWRSFTSPFTTVLAYSYTVDDMAETVGYLVRQERVLPAGSGIVDILPQDGEKVAAGQTVAVLYRDETALERRQAIRALKLQLEQLEYSITQQQNNTSQISKLDEEIVSAMTTLRANTLARDFASLDDQAMSLKSLVFRRAYSQSGQGLAELEARKASLLTQIAALEVSAASDMSAIAAPCAGTYASLVDGYEDVLTFDALNGLTVSKYSALTARPAKQNSSPVGKLITNSRWYFVTLLSQQDAARLYEGCLITVAFSRDFTREVSMRVEQLSQPENGQVAVVLSSTRHLADTVLLRRQKVDLVFQRHTGIRVPRKALRVLEDGTVGVYALAGAVAEFRPVEIVAEEEEFYLVASPKGVKERLLLREGDEIIVAATNLYDGKVVD